MKGGGGWWKERDREWKEISGGWGKHGTGWFDGNSVHIAHILLSSISRLFFFFLVYVPSNSTFSRILAALLADQDQTWVLPHFFFSSFVLSFISFFLYLLFFFKVFSHQRQFALPRKLWGWTPGILGKCIGKLLHLNMCLMVWLPQFMTGSNLCAAVLFCSLGFIGERDADVQHWGLILTVWSIYMNPTDSGVLTFHLTPPSDQNFYLSSALVELPNACCV